MQLKKRYYILKIGMHNDLLCHTAKFEAFSHKNASTGYNE